MKRSLIIILSSVFWMKGISQPTTTNPYLGAPTTLTYVRGFLNVDSGFYSSGNSFELLNQAYINFTTDTNAINAAMARFQMSNNNITLSNLDSTGNGTYFLMDYNAGFPYPHFNLSATYGLDNTQITGTPQALTLSQNSGNLIFENLSLGAPTDSILTIDRTTNRIRFRGELDPLFLPKAENSVSVYAKSTFNTDWFHGTDTALTFTDNNINFRASTLKAINFSLKANSTDTFWHNYERWEIISTVELDSLPINSDGFFIGINAPVGLFGVQIIGGPSSINHSFAELWANGAPLSPAQGVDFTRGDVFIISIRRDRNRLIGSMNKAGGTPVVWQIPIDIAGGSYALPTIISSFNIQLYEGEFSIKNVQINFNDARADVAFFGHSIIAGAQASPIYTNGWVQTIRRAFPNVTMMGGPAALTSDFVKALPSVVAALPQKVALLLAANDFANALPLDSTKAHVTKIIDTLVVHGITPIIISELPETSYDVRPYNTWLQATFPQYLYIDLFTGMANTGTYTMQAAYSFGDGLPHPNNAGHAYMANYFLDKYSPTKVIDQTRTFLFNGAAQFQNLRLNNLTLSNGLTDSVNKKLLMIDTAFNVYETYWPTGGGGVSSVSDLTPLFTTSNPITTPTFVLSNAAATTIYGNFTSGSTTPSFNAASADGNFLVRRSGSLTFGSIVQADIPLTSGRIAVGGIAVANKLGETGNLLYDAANGIVEVTQNSLTNPGFSFTGATNYGMGIFGSNLLFFSAGTVGLVLTASSSSYRIPSGFEYSWSSATDNTGASDAGISRLAAGKVGVGNGTAADVSGTFVAASVGIGQSSPAASSLLDIVSTSKGVLLPRMTTTQRDAIGSPATGLTLFCSDCTATDASTGVMQTYNGSTWKNYW